MISGVDLIYIFQSGILLSAYFVFLHVFFRQEYEPISLFLVAIGLMMIQLSNYLLVAIFESYVITELSILIVIGPIIEEMTKIWILIYLVVREEKYLKIRKIVFQGSVIGLGFGVGELIGYTLIYGRSILFQRSVLLIFGHPLYGAMIGLSLFGLNFENLPDLKIFDLFQNKIIYSMIIPATMLLHSLWNFSISIDVRLLIMNIFLHSLIWYGLVRLVYDIPQSLLEA